MKISPEIIPHENFHQVSWLCACERPAWYYFVPREHGNTIANKKFFSSVDGPLQELVKFLHRKNILTTPSCSGHNKSVKEFEKIYSGLKEEKKKINHKGLLFEDVETAEPYLFRDAAYRLPWTKSEFILRVMRQQEKGIIGLVLNGRENISKRILSLHLPGVDFYERRDIVFIRTQNSMRWNDITPAVKKIFQEFF